MHRHSGRKHRKEVRALDRPRPRIPGSEEWAGDEAEIDARYAYADFFGKSVSEVMRYFSPSTSIQRAADLAATPRRAFQTYTFASTVRLDVIFSTN
jgi:hypothetical protein